MCCGRKSGRRRSKGLKSGLYRKTKGKLEIKKAGDAKPPQDKQ